MSRPSRRNRGLSLIAVILMFILMAAAVTSLSLLFATENRRTLATASGAQLHQLLLASQSMAADELRLHGPASRDLSLATPVSGATLTLSFAPAGNNKVQVRTVAKLSRAWASQTLTYTRSDAGPWRLESAVLGNEP